MIKHQFNNAAVIYPQMDGYDASGVRALGSGVAVRCAVPSFTSGIKATNVVASSTGMSASRGTAWENVGNMYLLFQPSVTIAIGDKVTVAGMDTRVITVFPRFDVSGQLDHYQVEVTPWQ